MQNTPDLTPKLIPATLGELPIIQNLWLFYIYDMGRQCGFNKGWESPTDLSFTADDITPYFIDPERQAFLITIQTELAGFVFLNKKGILPSTNWSIGEFFILNKFQGKGVGKQVANQLWNTHPGCWELSIIAENTNAVGFWRNAVARATQGKYTEEIKTIVHKTRQEKRHLLSFIIPPS